MSSIRCLLFRDLNDENRSITESNNEKEVEDFNNHSVFSHADVVAPSEADGADGLTKSGSSEDKNELSENSIENI